MNNVHPFSNRGTIEAEAREWLIRLDGDTPLSDEETAALREWAGRSPAHRQELKRISKFWENANILTELAIPLHSNPAPDNLPATDTGIPLRYRFVAVAAIFLLAIGIIFTSRMSLPGPDTTHNGIYGTAIGQQRTVALPDGSAIQLNTDSQVQIDYGASVRKVRLLRGESLFEVAPDPDKPFEVYAGGNMVRAVGTAFSVQLNEDSVKVTVAEGKVELVKVENEPASFGDNSPPATRPVSERLGFLEHGQSATIGNTINELHTLAQQELDQQLAWHNGFLSFSGEPLKEVVKEINRYTPVTIEIADPALETLQVGGRFRVDDLEAMLEVLETSFGIRVSRIGDQRILLRAAGAPSG
jgi:transmembrane sensor